MELAWWGYPLLFAAGSVAGTVNVVAGGGSFLTLPILILLGLPPGTANGTNRVAILLQNAGAVWSFWRHGALPPGMLLRAGLPASAGAALGTWIALEIGDDTFRRILALLTVVAVPLVLWGRPPRGRGGDGRRRAVLTAAGFLLAGVYGGFVQAGVGFLILAVTSLAGWDLVQGNAVKVLCVLAFTVLSLALFAWGGRVEWLPGLALAAGTVTGGQLGVRLTVTRGHAWVRGAVALVAFVLALRLWLA